MGIPVQYDEFGRPISPRFAEPAQPDFPRIHEPKKREGTFATTLRVKEWLSHFGDGAREFAEDTGCEADVILLVMAGFISQSVQVVADAMGRNTRWVRPRVKRLRDMGIWVGEDRVGPRFDAWYAGMRENGSGKIGPKLWVPMLLDIMEIDGQLESERDESGELRFFLSKRGSKLAGDTA